MELTREQLLGCLSVRRWADEVLAGQPYADRAALLSAADAAARTLSDDELDEALSGHPRIGERAAAGHNAAASAREQAGVDPDEVKAKLLLDGNLAYEDKFGHVFLIRALGRTGDEIQAELDRRLENDAATERAETVDNLRQIALLRLEGLLP